MNKPNSDGAAGAMIVSVGGTPAPVIESIRHFRPVFVSFFASQETLDKVMEIKGAIKAAGLELQSEVTLAENVNDLLHCHKKAEEAVARVIGRGHSRDSVIVDYTGGTKNMSVALSLAAITHGFSFSYVGGTRRTRGNVGTVENGAEKVFQSVNPWDFLAVEERKKIALLFNRHQFKAAGQLCADLAEKNVNRRLVYKKIGLMIEGFHEWDLLRHKTAVRRFEKCEIDELLDDENKGVQAFAKAAKALLPFLADAAGCGEKPCPAYILDLFANAERRFDEGKTDDAVLRLYRIVEMAGQQRLMDTNGIDTSNAAPEKLPAGLKSIYEEKYMDPESKTIKISMAAGYSLLKEMGDDLGLQFYDQKDSFLKIQDSRNHSFLAHGFRSAREAAYMSLRDFIVSLNIFQVSDVPRFPVVVF
ncbi:TIGR02710 family CRISPR-associated CARF protein [Desulfosudis oleivorans]|nr:TIGR02710 family CRISPR-associated CARF protein [Desulfosudis oleivorans]